MTRGDVVLVLFPYQDQLGAKGEIVRCNPTESSS
jgi:hypothetical protein